MSTRQPLHPFMVSTDALANEADELALRLLAFDPMVLDKANALLLARAVREALEILDEDAEGIE